MKYCSFFVIMAVYSMVYSSSTIKVSCIGNSITQGNMGGAYPKFLQTLLGAGYQVENDGVSGTTLLKKGDNPYWTKGKLLMVFKFKPDIVTIKLGTNDTKSQNWDAHGSEFKKDYLALIDTLGTLEKKPAVFLVLPVPVFKANNYGIRDSVIKKIIVMVKEIGKERGLPIIDANTPLLPFGNYFEDGVHPTAAGADTIAHVLYRALKAATGNTVEKQFVPVPRVTNGTRDAATLHGLSENEKVPPSIGYDLNGRVVTPAAGALVKVAPALRVGVSGLGGCSTKTR